MPSRQKQANILDQGVTLIFMRTLLTEMDNQIDAYPPMQWNERFGLSQPGDAPSAFVEKFVTNDLKNYILEYARNSGDSVQGQKDIYTELNFAGMCLNEMSQCAKRLHDAKTVENREAYIAANEKLFGLCVTYMFHPPHEVAEIIRTGTGHAFEHSYEALMQRYPEETKRGAAAKIAKDVRNWAAELRMEMEHRNEGFLKSNIILHECEKAGISLEEIYGQFKERFEHNTPIKNEELPEPMRSVIAAQIKPYEGMIRQYDPYYRMFGLPVLAESYNTILKDTPGRPKPLSFAETLAKRTGQLAGLGNHAMGRW